MNNLMKGLVASAAMGFAATAAAFPVDLESVSGAWSNYIGGSNVNGVGTDTLHWGDGKVTCVFWGFHCTQGPQSGYGFEGAADLPKEIASDDSFVLGIFTHYNNEITGEAITGVNLDVFATFSTTPDNGNVTGPYTFKFLHDETPNEVCGPFSWLFGCSKQNVDDIVRLDNMLESSEFHFGSNIYSLSLLGFDGGVDEINTEEGRATSVNLLAKLNVRSVPEPGTLALLGLGLAGLGLRRRRKAG